MLTIEMLNADEGDALWIEYGPDGGPVSRVLVDCGRKAAYRAVRGRLLELQAAGDVSGFELFVLTHVDDDHIFGAVPLLADAVFTPARVGDVWFNGWTHLTGGVEPPPDAMGALKGEFFAALLQERAFPWNEAFGRGPIVVPDAGPLPTHTLPGGMKLTVLSPNSKRLEAMREDWRKQLKAPGSGPVVTPGDHEAALAALEGAAGMQADMLGGDWLDHWDAEEVEEHALTPYVEDSRAPNGSTIALLAEYEGKAVLLGGDAYPSVLLASLRRLQAERGLAGPFRLDGFKVPHHGSENNLSPELVAAVDCKDWLVSTNGTRHHHPHPAAIARIVCEVPGARLHFNYRSPESEVWDGPEVDHGYTARWGTDGRLVVRL